MNSSTSFRELIKAWSEKVQVAVKSPSFLLPSLILGAVWLILSIMSALEYRSFVYRLIYFLTYADGGMYGGFVGIIGGILGKIIVLTFLNSILIPLFKRKKPLSGFFTGLKACLSALAIKTLSAWCLPLIFMALGIWLAALVISGQIFMNSMAAFCLVIFLIMELVRANGLVFSFFNLLSKPFFRGASTDRLLINYLPFTVIGLLIGILLSLLPIKIMYWAGFFVLVIAISIAILFSGKKGGAK